MRKSRQNGLRDRDMADTKPARLNVYSDETFLSMTPHAPTRVRGAAGQRFGAMAGIGDGRRRLTRRPLLGAPGEIRTRMIQLRLLG